MQIYVEYLIIDNFIFDYLLLLLASYKKIASVKKGKVVFSAVIGTIIAILFPLLKINEFILFLLKICIAFLLVFLAYGYKNFTFYFSLVVRFVILTFLFGGSIYGIASLCGINYAFLYGTSSCIIPLGLLVSIAVVLYYLFKNFINRIYSKGFLASYSCYCKIYMGGKCVDACGYFDSGNHATYKNNPVCFSSYTLNKKLFERAFFANLPIGEIELITATGKEMVSVYKFDKLEIYFNNKKNIIYSPYIAISKQNRLVSEDYELILSCNYLNDSGV